jgi:hypothetical protein
MASGVLTFNVSECVNQAPSTQGKDSQQGKDKGAVVQSCDTMQVIYNLAEVAPKVVPVPAQQQQQAAPTPVPAQQKGVTPAPAQQQQVAPTPAPAQQKK